MGKVGKGRGPAFKVTPEQEAFIREGLAKSSGQATLYGKPLGIDPETGDVVVTDPATGIVRPVQVAPLPPSGLTVKDVFDGIDHGKLVQAVWDAPVIGKAPWSTVASKVSDPAPFGAVITGTPDAPEVRPPVPTAGKSIGEHFAEGVSRHFTGPAAATTASPAPDPTPWKAKTGLLEETMIIGKDRVADEKDRIRVIGQVRRCLMQAIGRTLEDGREYLVRQQVMITDRSSEPRPIGTVKVHAVASVALANPDAAMSGEYVAYDEVMEHYNSIEQVDFSVPGWGKVQMWRKK